VESIINFILSNIFKISVFDISLILFLGGIMFVFLNRYYKDKYKLIVETNKEAFDLQNKIINSYKEITNNNVSIKDNENILSINNALTSDTNRSTDETISDNQFDSISPIICKLIFLFMNVMNYIISWKKYIYTKE
jgi:predicted RNase H-like nuclease